MNLYEDTVENKKSLMCETYLVRADSGTLAMAELESRLDDETPCGRLGWNVVGGVVNRR